MCVCVCVCGRVQTERACVRVCGHVQTERTYVRACVCVGMYKLNYIYRYFRCPCLQCCVFDYNCRVHWDNLNTRVWLLSLYGRSDKP